MRVEFRPKLNSIVKKGAVIQQDHVITDGLKRSPLENQIYNATRKKFTLWKREKYLPDSQETKDLLLHEGELIKWQQWLFLVEWVELRGAFQE